ncbi:MAG: hypothetical protein ACE15C_00410 [Phycisphaerae bacterium]
MRTSAAVVIVAIVALYCMLPAAGGSEGGGAPKRDESRLGTLDKAAELELTKNPAAVVSPAAKAGELTVYGVKLGDAADKIPNTAAVSAQSVPERPQDVVHMGRDVSYYAFQGKIYRIRIQGDLANQIPTYDADRLQVALGKADDILRSASGEDTRLSFIARHLRFTVHSFRMLSVIAEVDLYAP